MSNESGTGWLVGCRMSSGVKLSVTAARDPGRVTAILYRRLATSHRSLAIILPRHIYMYYHWHARLQPYSNKYHTYTHEAERRHTCPYSIIALSVN